jgi:hypothetical protein
MKDALLRSLYLFMPQYKNIKQQKTNVGGNQFDVLPQGVRSKL